MKSLRISIFCALGFVFLRGVPAADGQLHWPRPRKQEIEVRLIALAVEYPRSSFFSNDEVFVAEQELSKEESRFIKLVYDFLPYQSPLSDSGSKLLVGAQGECVARRHMRRKPLGDAAFDETAAAS